MRMLKFIVPLLVLLSLQLIAQEKYTSEPNEFKVGWRAGKYPPTITGIQSAIDNAFAYRSDSTKPVVIFSPGVYQLDSNFVRLKDGLIFKFEGEPKFVGKHTRGIFTDDSAVVSVKFYGDYELQNLSVPANNLKPYNGNSEIIHQTETLFDSTRFSWNYDRIDMYLTSASQDSFQFPSAEGDSLEIWWHGMLFKDTTKLAVVTEGIKKKISIPRIGRTFFIDFQDGTNHPDSFSTSGVKNLYYAAYLINRDYNSIKVLNNGTFEDSVSVAASWTFSLAPGGDGLWKTSDDIITGLIDPITTQSVMFRGGLNKALTFRQYFTLDSGEVAYNEFLYKLSGAPAIATVSVFDSITNTKYFQTTLTPGGWAKFGGSAADTITTRIESMNQENDRLFSTGLGQWTGTGNHSIELSTEPDIIYEGTNVAKITAGGAGDATANFVSLPYQRITEAEGNDYTLTFPYLASGLQQGDSIFINKGDITFGIEIMDTENWVVYKQNYISTSASATGNFKVYANSGGSFYIDGLSIIWEGGTRRLLYEIKLTGVNTDTLWIDNAMLRLRSSEPWGSYTAGDCFFIRGIQNEPDSFQINGQYIKGNASLPITMTAESVEEAKLLCNWQVDNPINVDNVSGFWVSYIHLEKAGKQGIRLVMTPALQDGYYKVLHCSLDSIGRGVSWIPPGQDPNSLSGTGLAIQIRGHHSEATGNKITNIWNDAFNCSGFYFQFYNNWCNNICWSPIGDGIQLTSAHHVVVNNNTFIASRSHPDSLFGHKAGLNLNANTTNPAGRYFIAKNNVIKGFNGGIGGHGTYSWLEGNDITDIKVTDHTIPYTGGEGISSLGDSCYVVNNVIKNSVYGLRVKWQGDIWFVNNTITKYGYNTGDVDTIKGAGLYGKGTWTATGDSIRNWNNIFHTDSATHYMTNVPADYPIAISNYNIYYAPDTIISYAGQSDISGLQSSGFEQDSYFDDPQLKADLEPAQGSPAKLSGTAGLTFRNKKGEVVGLVRNIGAY